MYAAVLAYDQAVYMGEIALQYEESELNACIMRISLAFHLREVGDFRRSAEKLEPCAEVDSPDAQINITIRTGLALTALAEADTATAVMQYEAARSLIADTRNPVVVTRLLSDLGQIYIRKGDSEKAEEIAGALNSLPFPALPPPAGLIRYHYLSLFYKLTQNYEASIRSSDSAIHLADQHQLQHQLGDIYSVRSTIFEKQGQAQKALDESRKQIELNNRITEIRNEREEASARVRYELRMNEASLASAIRSGESSSKRLWMALAVSAGLMLIAVVLFRRYKSSEETLEQVNRKLTRTEIEHKKLQEFIRENNRMRQPDSSGGKTGDSALSNGSSHSGNGEKARQGLNGELIQFSKQLRISADAVMYIRSEGNYVRIFLSGGKKPLLERISLKRCSELMPAPQFIRIHRSTIVNINHVERIENESLFLHDSTELKLSRRYKKEMAELLT